jgi:hypothetical protein
LRLSADLSGVFTQFLRWFDGWAGSGEALLLFGGFAVFTFPFVLAHELGHAAVGLLASDGPVNLRVGRSSGAWRGRIGRLRLKLHPLMPGRSSTESAGRAGPEGSMAPAARLVMILAGPAASVTASALALLALLRVHGPARTFLAGAVVLGVLHSIHSLVPFSRHGHRSDGRLALDTIRVLRGRAIDTRERPQRFNAMITGQEGAELRTRQRMETIGRGATRLLGLNPDPRDPTASRAAQAAFGGWCWRHLDPVAAAQDPQVRQTLKTAYELHVDAINARIEAASALTRKNTDPPGATGRDSAAHRAHLASVLANAVAGWSATGLTKQQVELAVRYGIELHDVENAAGVL